MTLYETLLDIGAAFILAVAILCLVGFLGLAKLSGKALSAPKSND